MEVGVAQLIAGVRSLRNLPLILRAVWIYLGNKFFLQ